MCQRTARLVAMSEPVPGRRYGVPGLTAPASPDGAAPPDRGAERVDAGVSLSPGAGGSAPGDLASDAATSDPAPTDAVPEELGRALVEAVEERLRAAGASQAWPDDEAVAELWARYGIDPDLPYAEQEERYRALFRDPWFVELDRRRRLQYAVDGVPIARRSTANGSVGAALALGFRNVFDPDRKRDDVVAMSERGDGDGDTGLKLDLDPTDPRRTKATIRRR